MPTPLEVLRMIREDARRDAENLDGRAFDGKTVAVQFGQTLAMIAALARVIEENVPLNSAPVSAPEKGQVPK